MVFLKDESSRRRGRDIGGTVGKVRTVNRVFNVVRREGELDQKYSKHTES